MRFLVSLIQRPSLFPDMGLLQFSFRLIIIVLQRSMHILFTDRVLPTIRCTDQILRGEVSPCRLKITAAYAFISSSSRFCPSLTGLAVCVGKECRATAEMTQFLSRSRVE